MKFSFLQVFAAVACLVMACSVVKKEASDKEVRIFLSSFQASLTQPDEVILKQFDSKQSREALVSAIRILKNEESEYVTCEALFESASILNNGRGTQVNIPVVFHSKNLEMDYQKESTLTLWVTARAGSIVITQLDGMVFYAQFAMLRNEMQWSTDRAVEIKKRQPLYARAKALQQNFDSVIWCATYNTKNYFYVVNGVWNNSARKRATEGYTMGLVDESGNTIIPPDYELIGTIGFDLPGMVEIKKAGKVGYFNIETKQLVAEPAYDMIIPYGRENILCIVKQDTVYGWINDAHVYTAGFPSEKINEWVNGFGFLPKDIRLANGVQTLCEIPAEGNAGYGILMPPSYLVKTGLFEEIIEGLSSTPIPMSGGTEYVEAKGTILQTITDQINAMFTTITNRYLDGREEFYIENRLVFVDKRNDTLAVADIPTKKVEHVKRIGQNVLEVKAIPYTEWHDYDAPEYDIPEYKYFTLGEDLSIVPLRANRKYTQTQFAKLDSSYLTGEFQRYDRVTGENLPPSSFLSAETLEYMQKDILASYGMTYPEGERYDFPRDYNPRYTRREEFEDQITDIDRYNLQFLEKIIALLKTKPA
ncbi:WG repeat-containing protein [Chryseolinea soli]|uniref:WG repeat-containing protein n=1 Tax=Chryseolinea soli TaxID=2321403 RepID=A0A385SLX4_9BACT|nr:WG repeat-containing protein [Chryseolinea soli]AYB32269.1 hypothetical protein D4L85_17570 [Chryseolinea soli]